MPQPQLDQAADYESAASMPLSQLTQVTLHQSPSLGLQQPAAGLPPGFVRRDYASMRAMLMHLSGGERARVAQNRSKSKTVNALYVYPFLYAIESIQIIESIDSRD